MTKHVTNTYKARQKKLAETDATKRHPTKSGKEGCRLLWDSYYQGQYIKKEHGPLV